MAALGQYYFYSGSATQTEVLTSLDRICTSLEFVKNDSTTDALYIKFSDGDYIKLLAGESINNRNFRISSYTTKTDSGKTVNFRLLLFVV